MNNPSPNPLLPQGSTLEQKNKSRARFKIAFFSVLAVNIIPIVIALLMQGCRKPPEEPMPAATNAVPALDTTAPAMDTNAPATNAPTHKTAGLK